MSLQVFPNMAFDLSNSFCLRPVRVDAMFAHIDIVLFVALRMPDSDELLVFDAAFFVSEDVSSYCNLDRYSQLNYNVGRRDLLINTVLEFC